MVAKHTQWLDMHKTLQALQLLHIGYVGIGRKISWVSEICMHAYIYTMVKPYIKGADRCIFMHIHLKTQVVYIY